jgi:pimeloyl-ACP methyl ester carboxylesterase
MQQVTPQSNFLKIKLSHLPEVQLHYLTYGNPALTPVFCVHGLSCNAYDFDFLARVLAQDYYVIAVDVVGRGLSSHFDNKDFYTNDHHLALCIELLAHLRITQPVHWVGASMGGIMGMMACFLYPDKIRSLMLNDVGAVLAKEGLAEIMQYLSNKLPIGDNAKFEAAYRAQNEVNFGLRNEAHWQHFFRSRIYTDELGIWRLRGDFGVLKPMRELIGENPQDISLEALWLAVKCPVMIFRGENSQLLRHNDAVNMQNRNDILVELHEIAGVGHMPSLIPQAQTCIIHNWLLGKC